MSYDVFHQNDANFTLYVSAKSMNLITFEEKVFVYSHKIDSDAYKNSEVKGGVELLYCGDEILATQSILVVQCAEEFAISIIERENMFKFPIGVTLSPG